MTKQHFLARTTATATAAGFLLLSAGPATAAGPVAQAEAEAITLSVGGMSVSDQLGGPYRVVREGGQETATGNNEPQAELLTGQTAAAIGTLAQDATTALEGGRGTSAACAGIAGDGASAASVGDAGEFCLAEGDSFDLTAGQLGLGTLLDVSLVDGTPNPGDGLEQLPDDLQDGMAREQMLADFNEDINQQIEPFEDAGLVFNVGAIQSRCTAGPGDVADGSANLAGVGAFLDFGDTGAPVERLTLLEFEANPAPNTNVALDLNTLFDLLVTEVVDSLDTTGLPPELTDALGDVKVQVRDQILKQVANQLGPLNDNLVSGVLNKQTTGPGEIEVTALDLQVPPAVADQVGARAIDAQLGRSSCGPGGQQAAPPAPEQPQPETPAGGQTPQPAVPTSVPAGLADDSDGVPAELGLAALTVLATATGIAVHRRQSRA